MCEFDASLRNTDPAQKISTFLSLKGWNVSSETLRYLVKNYWKEIAAMAHAIHDEENSEQAKLDKALVRVGELSFFEWKKIVEGRGDAVPTDAAKTVARAILKDEKYPDPKTGRAS